MRRLAAGRQWVEEDEGIGLLPARAPRGALNASSAGSMTTTSSTSTSMTFCCGLQEEGTIALVVVVCDGKGLTL